MRSMHSTGEENTMRLRKLLPKDAPLMLEWMHDETVVAHLGANFAAKTLDDCKRFIAQSYEDRENLHMAVVDDGDEYMGTVSLKHTDFNEKTAEFAITVRASAMGRGYSGYGMKEILSIGTEELGLNAIYWCVSKENKRAVRFYDKCGYTRTENVPQSILECYAPEQQWLFLWYVFPKAK